METKNNIPPMPQLPNISNLSEWELCDIEELEYIRLIEPKLTIHDSSLSIYFIFLLRYYYSTNDLEELYKEAIKNGSIPPQCPQKTYTDFMNCYANIQFQYTDNNGNVKDIWEEYCTNKELKESIKAFKIESTKLWYLLCFLKDYVDNLQFKNKESKTIQECLGEATSIVLKKGDEEICTIRNKAILEVLSLLPLALKKASITPDYQFKDYYLAYIASRFWLTDGSEKRAIKKNAKERITCFYGLCLLFLEDKKGHIPEYGKECKISTRKETLISRLLYTIGYADENFNKNKHRAASSTYYNNKDKVQPISSSIY